MADIKVIFVCTGNTCRSSMAEGIFKAITVQKLGNASLTAISRGMQAYAGDSASRHSIEALKTLWNIDISGHRAKMLDPGDVLQADLILTMTRAHRDALKLKYPDKQSRIFTLKEYAYPELGLVGNTQDIIDPYGMPYQIYESCAKEIFESVQSVLDRLS